MWDFSFFKNNLGLLLTVFFVGSFLIFVSFFQPHLPVTPDNDTQLPDFSFEDVIVSHIDNGQLQWQVEAKSASIHKLEDEINMKELKGCIFDRGKKVVQFKAETADMKMNQSDMILHESESELYIEKEAILIKTDQLSWFSDQRSFLGEGAVRLVSTFMTMNGAFFEASLPLKTMRVYDAASARIYSNTIQ